MKFIYRLIISLFIVPGLLSVVKGEGTKEIYPSGWDNYKFYLSPNDAIRNRFALYTATDDEKLFIDIKQAGEVIFFGFQEQDGVNNFKFRIKNEAGVIVFAERQVPNSGQGYIQSLAQARIGPVSIFPGGYSPLRYIAPDSGRYYIEFQTPGGDKEFELFDITVTNSDSTIAYPGRVWSKGWQCTATGSSNRCGAKFFVYSNDQIVTSVDFNGMRPYAFDISCNSTGCYDSGDFIEDRKSRPGRNLYPQYKLFLNNPDSTIFPTGVLGKIDSVQYTSYCDGTVDFRIWVNKEGNIELLLDLYPPAGYSSGDVKLPGQVEGGVIPNVFSWNGKDGNGVDVPNAKTFLVTTTYLNGLTHLPLYDSEYNLDFSPLWQGYSVSLVRPSGAQPALFWDDTYCGGNTNLSGCIAPAGCHTWGYGVGNQNTINTWWYAASLSAVPITLLKKLHITYDSAYEICQGDSVLIAGAYRKVPGDYTIFGISAITGCDSNVMVSLSVNPNPVVDLGADVWICEGETHTFNAGSGTGYTYQWDNLTTGTTNIGTGQTYVTGTPGFYKVTVTTADGCHKSDSVHLFAHPKPHLTNNPFSDTICSASAFNIALTSNVTGTNFIWYAFLVSGNITGFGNGSGTVINQVLTNNLTTQGVVKYTITPVAGGCFGNDTNYFVVVKPKPLITTNPLSYQICHSSMTNITLTSNVAGSTFVWKASGSSPAVTGYSNGSGTIIQQTLSNTSYTNQVVTYKAVANINGCNGDTTIIQVTVRPKPDMSNSPASKSICDSTVTNISLTSNVTGTLFTWRAFGSSPLVTGFSNNLVPAALINQRLRNNDVISQTVTYRLLPVANGCNGDSVDFVVTVFPNPKLSTSPLSKQICNNGNTGINLSSNVAGTLFSWTCTPGSGNISGYSNSPVPGTTIDQILTNTGNSNETVTYHITPQSNGCNGWLYHYVVTVVPTATLTNNPKRKVQCNGLNTNIVLTSNVTGTKFSWTAVASSPSITGYSNSVVPGNLISQTLFNNGYSIDSVTYTLSPLVNGCNGTSSDFVVVVNPKPDLSNAVKSFSICDSTVISVPLTSNVAGTTFTWRAFASSPALTGYSSQGSGVTLINQRIDNTGFTTQTVTYRVSPRANGCSGDSTDIVVTVFAKPNLSNPVRAFSICDSTMATLALTSNVAGTTFTWRAFASSPNLAGYSSQPTASTLINQRIDNTGFTTQTVTYRILPSANACAGDSIDVVFTVFPTADLSNTVLTQSICDSTFTNISLSSNVTGTTFTWRAFGSSPLVTGFANQATGTTSIAQQLRNNSTTPQTVTYRIMPRANNCNGDSIDFVVTVFPKPKLTTSPLSKEICNNNSTGVSLVSDVAGTLFTWTYTLSSPNIVGAANSPSPDVAINQNLINTGDTPESVTYHITPAANGCSGWVYQYSVTVIPSPYLTNNPLRQTQCNGSNTSLNLISNVAGTQFNWTATASSGSLSGYSNSAAPGTLISQTLFNSGFNVDSVTYHVTPLSAGCPGSVTNYNVVVFPKPDLSNAVKNFSICDSTVISVPLISNVAGTTFTWRAFASSPALTGYSSQGSGVTLINQRIDNTGFTTQTVTYRVSPRANGCSGDSTDIVVTVFAKPNLSNPVRAFSICDSTMATLALTSNVAGTAFTWRAFASSPLLSGFSSQASGVTLINQRIDNLGFSTETVTYRILPSANACAGDSIDVVYTVFPTADLSNTVLTQSICDSTFTAITLSSHVSGTTFTWRAFGSSPLVTGFANQATGTTSIAQQLRNNSSTPQTVTYRIMPRANNCNGDSIDFVVTVFPKPKLTTSPLSKEICNNNSTGVSLVSDVAGTLFTWTYTLSSPNIVGAANSPSPDVAINQNLINTGDTPESVTYHITPAANGCSGWVYQYSVTVIPSPYLTNNPLRQTQCNGSNTSLNLISNVAGTQFDWTATASSGSLSGYSNSAAPGTLISQTLFNSGFNVDSVTYHVTPLSAGCPGSVTDFNVVVYPVPDVYFDPVGQTLCEGQVTGIALRSHALGTSYVWTATSSSSNLSGYADGAGSSIAQVISNAGSTVESVTYQVTPAANGCPAGATQNVLVNIRPRPVLTNAVTSFSVCNNTPTSIFLTADVPGATFAWRAFASSPTVSGYSSSSGGSIIQTLFNSGFSVETVTFRTGATAFSCTGDSTDFSVTVFPVADAFYTPPAQAICPLQTTNILISSHVAGASFVFSASPSSARVTGYAGGAGDLIEQTLDNSGPYIETVTYMVAPMANGCPGANSSVVASVNPFPSVSFPLCIDPVTTTDAKPIRLKGAEPSGGTYSGKGVIANTFFPATAGVGPDTLVYIHSNSYSCTKSDTLIISVIAPLPFSCGGTLTDPRDNKQYPTVWINPQCWMAANLDYGIYLPGAASQRDNCVNEKYCYGDNPANCAAFGGLYQWDEIMGYDNTAAVQGLCPPAWHIPSEAEWSTLFAQYTSNGFAGNSLKYTGYSGFNALLNGARFKNVSWNFFDFATLFWSSTTHGPYKAWAHGMNQENPSVSLYPAARYNAFQVRCVKD